MSSIHERLIYQDEDLGSIEFGRKSEVPREATKTVESVASAEGSSSPDPVRRLIVGFRAKLPRGGKPDFSGKKSA